MGSRPLFWRRAAGRVLLHGSFTHRSLRNCNALVLAPLFFGVVAWAALSPAGRGAQPGRRRRCGCVAAIDRLRRPRGRVPGSCATPHARPGARGVVVMALPPGDRVAMVGNL
jgi:hypothetical protein